MPTLAWIEELFSDEKAPYTVAEITTRLRECWTRKINRDSVYRAIRQMKRRPALAKFVATDDDIAPALYSAEGARRITRYLTQFYELPKAQEPILLSERAKRIFGTPPPQLPRNSIQEPVQILIA